MRTKIKLLWKLLEISEKRKMLLLFLGMFLSSLFEFLSIGSLVPFLVNLSANTFSGSTALSQTLISLFDEVSPDWIPVFIFFLVSCKFIVTTLTHSAQASLGKSLQLRLALTLYERFIHLPLPEAEATHQVSISRLMEDTDHTSNEFFKNFCWLIHHSFLSISLVTLMLLNSAAAFGGGLLLCLTSILVYLIFIRPKFSELATRRLTLKKTVMTLIDTFHHNIIEAQAFKMKHQLLRNFGFAYETLVDVNRSKLLSQLNARPVVEFCGVILILVSYYLISLHYDDPGTPLVHLSMLTIILMRLAPSVAKIYGSLNAIIFSRPYLEELDQFLNRSNRNGSMDELPSREVSSIEFENVSFQYEARSAPQNLNLRIHSPGLYFLKGPNGSGKTTVLKIMAGLLRPTTGKVIINQDPLFLQHFIPHFSFLGQDVFLFSGSIKDNVTIHEKVSDPEWENFLEEFELESLINVHSSISFNGKECSGGEKKLIGLARALFQKSHFVLLDEPLASLDQRKRHLILNILKKHSLTRIIFMTGHQSLDENFFTQTFTIKSE